MKITRRSLLSAVVASPLLALIGKESLAKDNLIVNNKISTNYKVDIDELKEFCSKSKGTRLDVVAKNSSGKKKHTWMLKKYVRESRSDILNKMYEILLEDFAPNADFTITYTVV